MAAVLVSGPNVILGMHIAAQSLLSSAGSVCILLDECKGISKVKILEHICRIVASRAQGTRLDAQSYVHEKVSIVLADVADMKEIAASAANLDICQAWFLSGCSTTVEEIDTYHRLACTLVSALTGSRALSFNYIRPSYSKREMLLARGSWDGSDGSITGLEQRYREIEKDIVSNCSVAGIDCTLYSIEVLAGREFGVDSPLSSLDLALSGLHQFKNEIEERAPEYFEYHALRCYAAHGSHINVVSVEEAASALVAIAGERTSLRQRQHISSRQSIPFPQLCDWIGNAYGLSLLAVDDPGELNAVDHLFSTSLASLQACLLPAADLPQSDDCRATFVPGSGWPDKACALSVLKDLRQSQDEAVRERNRRVASVASELQPLRTVRNGSELSYFAAGAGGTPVVLVNALGQSLRYWQRLMSELVARHRVLTWEQRGIHGPQPFRLADHVEDLQAILAHEGVTRCHLIAWCTGPKIAIEFYRRYPDAIASMVFLNSAFKCFSTPDELTTEYERNLEPLFRLLDRTPATAGVIMKSLQKCATGEAMPSAAEMNDEEIATRVLSLINSDLLPEVVSPFQSESGTVNYARQVLDFYSQDVSAYAAKVRVPVLLVGAEYDKIASSAISREFAKLFPEGRYVEAKGATHYCLYDRPEFLSHLIEDFFDRCERGYHGTRPVEQFCSARQ